MGALRIAATVFVVLVLGSLLLHLLWWMLVIALVLWLVGFAHRPRGGRWYYW